MKKLLTAFLAASALTLGAAGMADARDLRIAPGAPPAHPSNSHLYQKFVEYLPEESGGALTATVLGPEVVGLGQMKDALQSQIAEVGNLLPLYFPADLPMMSVTGQLSLTGTNSQAMGAALTEFVVNCEPCQQEMKNLGFVYLGSGASDVYEFLTTKPVHNAEDMKGLRLRSGGAPWARFAEHFGATPVQMSVLDQFEAMNSGTIDGSMASIADMLSFRLVEVAKYVTYAPIGLYFSTSNFTVAKPTWDSLSAEERAAMTRAANRANVDFTHRWGTTMPEEATAASEKAGVEFIEADPEFVEQIKQFIQDDIATAGSYSQEQFGIEDAPEQIQAFLGLVDKWMAIAEELDNDPQAIANRIQEEVWSKVDYASYGG